MDSKFFQWHRSGKVVTLDAAHYERILCFASSESAVEIFIGTTGETGRSANFRLKYEDGASKDYLGSTYSKGTFSVRSKSFVEDSNLELIWRLEEYNKSGINSSEDLIEQESNNSGGFVPGPIPYLGSKKGVEAPTDLTAYTYTLRYGNHSLYKIGWTRNPTKRVRTINSHIPTELPGHCPWKLVRLQQWSSPFAAYGMEQVMLKQLSGGKGERVACDADTLDAAWNEYVNKHSGS